MTSLLDKVSEKFKRESEDEISLSEYLDICKKDPKAYATPAERMLDAIGEPDKIDTSSDLRLSRIFNNRIIRRWKCFEDFYGIEDVIERLVDYFKHSSQNLEESKQILYLLGPVGGSKSTLAERLKQLMETQPFYAIKDSPVNDSPLALFSPLEHGKQLEKEYKIPQARLTYRPSPWLVKRLRESGGDLSWIKIVKKYPSINKQTAIARTEPGDENNQDISALVGKIDIRKLEKFSPNDPDAYSYSGGLCLANRGVLEFVEMFKAPIKVLHPLLTATQDRIFNGTESISSIPFEGIVLAHSNESEWESFKNDKKNEAFIDRVYVVKVPYCLRIDEEIEIYKKLIRNSNLKDAPVAPKTLELLATFSVISRLHEDNNEDIHIKGRVYNGENVKDKVNSPKTLLTYKKQAGVSEGMKEGVSPRFSFKILSKTFNYDIDEIAANPIHLMEVLSTAVEHEQFEKGKHELLIGVIKTVLKKIYDEHLYKEIQTAYLESYSEYGQNIFEKYLLYAEAWIDDIDYRDPNTGVIMNRDSLNKELEEIERPAGIANVSDFRQQVVLFCNRAKAKNGGGLPRWTDYEKLRNVIEKKLFLSTDEILPVISFDVKKNEDDEKKHKSFVSRMMELGYTVKQIRIVTQYYIQNRNRQE